MLPTTYNDHHHKREIQSMLCPKIKRNKAVCLAGPDVDVYLGLLPSWVKTIKIWENDNEMVLLQIKEMQSMKRKGVVITCGNIIDAPIDLEAFYDLDFCRTIRSMAPIITKFKDCAFSTTLSLRRSTKKETLDKFIEAVEEEKVALLPYGKFNMLKTNLNEYLYKAYDDGSGPMLNIFKLHN
jgi:hypothetical protein